MYESFMYTYSNKDLINRIAEQVQKSIKDI